MSPTSDLRTLWPTLSPREKDARVAEALGWALWTSGSGSLGNPQKQTIAMESPGKGWRRISWKKAWFNLPEFPSYSTSWQHAGPLLDRLHGEDWLVETTSGYYPEGDYNPAPGGHWFEVKLSRNGTEEVIEAGSEESLPDAISLAFCLSRESSR